MPVLENPTNFVSGSTRLTGDVQIDGKIDLGDDLDINEVVIGDGASISDSGNVAVGLDATASNKNTTALGQNATASGQDATALGKETTAPANWNTVVGYDAGSNLNGNNVVLVGRKAEAQGDNGTAVGEIATANGANSSAFGRDTRATADDASAFGHSSSASGVGTTVMGQSGTADQDNATALGSSASATGLRALAAGEGATASSNDATALGRNATASASDAIALGSGTTVSTSNTYGVGSRDIKIETGNKLIYPQDSGSQTLVNMPVSANPTAGTQQSYSLEVNSETILEINAEADGSGGIQNASADVPVDLNVTGNTTEVDNVITGDILLEDTTPTTQFRFDATVSPPLIELNGNDIRQLGATPAASTGALRLGNSTSILARNNADNNDFGIDFNSSDEVAINNAKLRLSSNLIASNGEIIWDENNTYIPQGRLQNDSITLSAGDGLKNGSTGALGGSFSLDVEPSDFAGGFLSDDGSDNLQVNITNGLESNGSDSIRVSGSSIAGSFLSEGTNAFEIGVDIGSGLEGDGVGNIRVNEDKDFTFTSAIDFSAGLDVQGDITDGTQVIWDISAQEIPDSAMGTIAATTLNLGNGVEDNSGSLRLNPGAVAGDGLKETSPNTLAVEPADFAGTYLSDDGSDNLTVNISSGLENTGTGSIQTSGGSIAGKFLSEGSSVHQVSVDIGRGLEGDGSGNIRVNEDTDFTFTADIDLSGGATMGGDLDLAGQSLTDTTQNYLDLTGDGNNLRLDMGQAIEDGSGTKRFEMNSGSTRVADQNGNLAQIFNDGVAYVQRTYSGTPWRLVDSNTNKFTAVEYTTDPSAGVLKTPNAGISVEDSGIPSGEKSLQLKFDASNEWGQIFSFDQPNSTYERLTLRGSTVEIGARSGLVDLTENGNASANLRLATGQAIEDGSGTDRIKLSSNGMLMDTETGLLGFTVQDSRGGGMINKESNGAVIRDGEGDFIPVQYTTSANPPGTLGLTDANLNVRGDEIRHTGSNSNFIINSSTSFAYSAFAKVRDIGLRLSTNDSSASVSLDPNETIELEAHPGGPVEINKSDLRLATGQAIEDGSGDNRITVSSGATQVGNGDGTGLLLQLRDGSADSGTKRHEFDQSGNVDIEGTLTENTAL